MPPLSSTINPRNSLLTIYLEENIEERLGDCTIGLNSQICRPGVWRETAPSYFWEEVKIWP